MEVDRLQKKFLAYMTGLVHEGFLDSQFGELQLLQDESNPDFVMEVVTLFFEDADRLLNHLSQALYQQTVDFKKIDSIVHQLKGSSSSIGACRIRNSCIAFRSFCSEQNVEECLKCLEQVKQEYLIMKTKLETLLQLERQIEAAGGVIPMLTEFCDSNSKCPTGYLS